MRKYRKSLKQRKQILDELSTVLVDEKFRVITEDVQNSVTKLMDNTERCKLKEKHSFGESAVLFNTLRTNSVQSLSTVELISISKNDFTDIVKDNLQLKWNENAIAIKNSSYFKRDGYRFPDFDNN
ncbi:unnamed protein product [Macrosiphum euphorbiae]|nr:unnamed protein product [Macrosiphum euphorbiae]